MVERGDPAVWNAAAFAVLGEREGEGGDVLGALAGLPAAVREWYRFGGDERLAELTDNLVTRAAGGFDERFRQAGFLMVATDSQHCVRWVVPESCGREDPPVYLVGPEDYACAGRERYAESFSAYTFTSVWDAGLWRSRDTAFDLDHGLPQGALARLGEWLTPLPVTYGWAGNQGCDAVYRFSGDARVAVAVAGATAVWSVVAADAGPVREHFQRLVGAS